MREITTEEDMKERDSIRQKGFKAVAEVGAEEKFRKHPSAC